MGATPQNIFDAARAMLEQTPGAFLQKYFLPEELDRMWAEAARENLGDSVFAGLLNRLGVRYELSEDDQRRVPARGPVVVVANHPFGLVEGAILGAILLRVRPDVKFLANSLLASIPELRDFVIAVDVFGDAARTNWKSLRATLEWLKQGGMLVTFPAGEVSSLRLPKLEIADPQWNENIARLIHISAAASLPVFFHGTNGAAFQIAGLIHPSLRTALLPRELLNKRGRTIRVSIGRPIGSQRLNRHTTSRETSDYLWQRTHLLQARPGAGSRIRWRIVPRQARIDGPVDAGCLREEADRLPSDQKLIESGDYQVCIAAAEQIPNTLHEIGRLREIAFRQAGEGTGRRIDLDRFDAHYQHLWIWNNKNQEVAGAYRLAQTDVVLSKFGPRGLYTNTLFRFRPGILEQFNPALELGRSFVRPEYQKSYAPLLLLWKGIGHYVSRNPRYRVLFGPVSISREYNPASRALMVSYLRTHCGNDGLAEMVAPRREFRSRRLRGCDIGLLGGLLANLEELSDAVEDAQPDGKGIPVLLRQYLNVGGQILAFNVDAQFSDVLDGLVVVDLLRMSPHLMTRYLGKDGAARFQLHHDARLRRGSSSSS